MSMRSQPQDILETLQGLGIDANTINELLARGIDNAEIAAILRSHGVGAFTRQRLEEDVRAREGGGRGTEDSGDNKDPSKSTLTTLMVTNNISTAVSNVFEQQQRQAALQELTQRAAPVVRTLRQTFNNVVQSAGTALANVRDNIVEWGRDRLEDGQRLLQQGQQFLDARGRETQEVVNRIVDDVSETVQNLPRELGRLRRDGDAFLNGLVGGTRQQRADIAMSNAANEINQQGQNPRFSPQNDAPRAGEANFLGFNVSRIQFPEISLNLQIGFPKF